LEDTPLYKTPLLCSYLTGLRDYIPKHCFQHSFICRCEFVLQRKGPEFVYQVASRVTSLNRAQSTNSFDPTSTTSACIADGMVISR